MLILAVDTSGSVCSAAVLSNKQLLSESYVDNKLTHSETLAPMIDRCLKSADADIKNIDLFCCAAGPGSFTGIRIGAGMIKAFSHASGRPAVGVNTLDALSYNMYGADGIVCPVIDARRGEVYTASYRNGKRISDYAADNLDNVLAGLKKERTVFVGDAAVNYREKILSKSPLFRVAHPGIVLQRAGSVGLAALDMYNAGVSGDAFSLEPFYLRKTQAERLKQRSKS
jgi:tRNA threonylcarbamoyladenosine biosynthesis protein TsaB